ncbi:MAG: DsbA family protein [Nanoarchaeota archaeon]
MAYFEKEKSEHSEQHTKQHKDNVENVHQHHEEDVHHQKKKLSNFQKFMAVGMLLQILLLLFVAYKISNLSNLAAGNVPGDSIPGDKPADNFPEPPSAPAIDKSKLADDDAVKGDKNAPVTIVEFSDYQCPFCQKFYTETFPQIEEKYIKTGKVKFVYRDFPLNFHQNAQKAAEAAECAGEQGKYYEMHNKLFEEGVDGGIDAFKQYAQDLKLDIAKFNQCLDSGKMKTEVQKDLQDGQSLGVSGTPAFFINGKEVVGAQPFSVFGQIIEQELKNKS